MSTSYDRLIVVGNPISTRAGEIQRDVFGRFIDEGRSHIAIKTRNASPDSLAEQLSFVDKHDRLLIAGGDGMLALAVNALRQCGRVGRESPQLGFMAYGNRNDGAMISGRAKRDAVMMAGDEVTARDYFPLRAVMTNADEDVVDDWLAVSYLSVGDLTGGATRYFNSADVRTKLKDRQGLLLRSAMLMRKYYHKHRQHLRDLSEIMTIDDHELSPHTTDIIALNGLVMASLVNNTRDHSVGGTFRLGEFDISQYRRAFGSYARILIEHGMPGRDKVTASVKYHDDRSDLSPIPLQTDGEIRWLAAGHSLSIDKPDDVRISVLTHR